MIHESVGIVLSVLCCLSGLASAQGTSSLQPGQPVESEIAGGQSHTYQIALQAGQFVRFRLEQRPIDAAWTLTPTDGKQLSKTAQQVIEELEEEALPLWRAMSEPRNGLRIRSS